MMNNSQTVGSSFSAVVAVTTALLLVAMVGSPIASAAKKKNNRDIRRELERERNRLRDDVRDYEAQLKRAESRRSEAKQKLVASDKEYEKAYKALRAAQDQRSKARLAETRMIIDLKKLAEADPELSKARAALEAAQQRETSERERVVAGLKGREDYAAAVAAMDKAKADLDELNRVGLATAEQRQAAAQAVIDKDQVIGGMRDIALEGDGKYQQAKDAFVEANQRHSEIQRRLDEKMRNDPGRQRTLEAVKAASDKVSVLTRQTSSARAEVNRHKSVFNAASADVSRITRAITLAKSRLRRLN